jgi:hypothetical protein
MALPESFGIHSHIDPEADVITWCNWRAAKDWLPLIVITISTVFWLLFTLGLTSAAVHGLLTGGGGIAPVGVSIVILPAFWAGLLLLLATCLRLGACETIRVTDEYLEVRLEGVLRTWTTRYSRDAVRELSFEYRERETVRNLNLWSEGVHRFTGGRTLLAYWLSDGGKAQVYKLLRDSLQRRGWAIGYRTDQ